MDDDKTLKFPPHRPAASSDDTTIELPMHTRGGAAAPHPHKATFFPGLKSAEARHTASPSMGSTQISAIPELPTLEYEHVWEATPGPPLSAAPPPSQYSSRPASRKKKRRRSPL